jgi:predicted outer membrane repeat protein
MPHFIFSMECASCSASHCFEISWSKWGGGGKAARPLNRRRLNFDVLEDRSLLSAYTVNTLADNPVVLTVSTEDGSFSYTSLRAAIDLANADQDSTVEINFSVAGTIYLEHGALPTFMGTETAPKNFVIDGTEVTIDAVWASGIFNIDAFANVTLDEFTLTNADVEPAICNNGELTLKNGTLCSARNGGIRNFSGTVTVENQTLTGNQNLNGDGGVLTNSDRAIVRNSTFSNNQARSGGAIASLGGLTTITDTLITCNSALIRGGAILNNAGIVFEGAGNRITSNFADDGGGIYNVGGISISTGTVFQANYAMGGIGAGGAIYNDLNGLVDMFGGSFVQNHAAWRGGAIFNEGTVRLRNVSLTSNGVLDEAGGKGGAICCQRGLTQLIQGCTVDGNFCNTANGGNGFYVFQGATFEPNPNNNTINDNTVNQ